MKVIRIILFFVISGSIILIVACNSIKNPKIINVQKIELEEDIDDLIILNTNVNIYNPNRFSISSNDISFKILVDSLNLGSGKLKNGLLLRKKDTSIVSATIGLNKRNIKYLYNSNDSIDINILGFINIPYVNHKHYFNYEFNINPSDIISSITKEIISDISFIVDKISVKKINFNSTDIEIKLTVENKSSIGCLIETIEIGIYPTQKYNEQIGITKIKNELQIKPLSENDFLVQVKLNTLKMGTTLFRNTFSQRNKLFLKINALVNYNNVKLPLKFDKEIEYNPITFEIISK